MSCYRFSIFTTIPLPLRSQKLLCVKSFQNKCYSQPKIPPWEEIKKIKTINGKVYAFATQIIMLSIANNGNISSGFKV